MTARSRFVLLLGLYSLLYSQILANNVDRQALTGCGCNPCPCASSTVEAQTVDYRLEVGGSCNCAPAPPCASSPCAPAPPCHCQNAPPRCGESGCGTAFDGKVTPEFKDGKQSSADIIIKPKHVPRPAPPTQPPTNPPTPAPTPAPTPKPTPAPKRHRIKRKPKKRKPKPKPKPKPTAPPKPSEEALKRLSKLAKLPKAKPADAKSILERIVNKTATIKLENEGFKKAQKEAEEEKKRAARRLAKRKLEQQNKDTEYKIRAMKDLIAQKLKIKTGGVLPLPPAVKPQVPTRGTLSHPSGSKYFGFGYNEPQWVRVGKKFCLLSGLSTVPKVRLMTSLPAECRPPGRMVFAQHGVGLESQRVDVLPNGNTYLVTGSPDAPWLSFDGVILPRKFEGVDEPTQLSPAEPWINFGAPYSPLSYIKEGDVCLLAGMVKLVSNDMDTWKPTITTLPAGCQPALGRISFVVNQHEQSHRIDVLPTGEVRWMSGQKSTRWLSLSGIAFSTAKETSNLVLTNTWKPFNNGFRVPSYNREKDLCIIGGTLLSPSDGEKLNKTLTNLPDKCRPRGHLIFATACNFGVSRFDVYPDGDVKLIEVTKKAPSSLLEVEAESRAAAKTEVGWWWWRRRHHHRPARRHHHHHHHRPAHRHHHHHHHRPVYRAPRAAQVFRPRPFVPAPPRPVVQNTWYWHFRWQQQREQQTKAAQRREHENKHEQSKKRHDQQVAERDFKHRQQIEAQRKAQAVRTSTVRRAVAKMNVYISNFSEQLAKGIASGKWSEEQAKLQAAALKQAKEKEAREKKRAEQSAKLGSEAKKKEQEAAARALVEQTRKKSEKMKVEFDHKISEGHRKRSAEHQSKANAKAYALAREAEAKQRENNQKKHHEETLKLKRQREQEALSKEQIAKLIKAGREGEAKQATLRDHLAEQRIKKLVKKVDAITKQIKQDKKEQRKDTEAAEKEHQRRVEQKNKAEKHRLAELAKKAEQSKKEEQRSKKTLQEEVFKLRRQGREDSQKLVAFHQEQIAKANAETAKYNKMEQDLKLHQDKVTRPTAEQMAKIQAPFLEEKAKLDKRLAKDRKAQEKATQASERYQKASKRDLELQRLKNERNKEANKKALADARKAKEQLAEDLRKAAASEQKAKLKATQAQLDEELSKGKISLAQKKEQTEKAVSKTEEARSKDLKRKLAADEAQQKDDVKRAKNRPKLPVTPAAQSPEEMDISTKKTGPLPLPPLPPAWYSLDGLRFVVKD